LGHFLELKPTQSYIRHKKENVAQKKGVNLHLA